MIYINCVSIKQWYNGLLSFNKEDICENVSLMKINFNDGTNNMVNLKFSLL